MRKEILILAGPNGAGKTTFAREYLPNEAGCQLFVNADLIAAGLSPFAPDQAVMAAGRLMLERIEDLVRRRESFAFETTLSGRAYLRRIQEWQTIGYHVKLFFLALPNPDMAIARVAERVRQGGHHVPDDVVVRRFYAGRKNFETSYRPLVDAWALYDNTTFPAVLLEWGDKL